MGAKPDPAAITAIHQAIQAAAQAQAPVRAAEERAEPGL
jgi:hypothetical protein